MSCCITSEIKPKQQNIHNIHCLSCYNDLQQCRHSYIADCWWCCCQFTVYQFHENLFDHEIGHFIVTRKDRTLVDKTSCWSAAWLLNNRHSKSITRFSSAFVCSFRMLATEGSISSNNIRAICFSCAVSSTRSQQRHKVTEPSAPKPVCGGADLYTIYLSNQPPPTLIGAHLLF